MAKQYNPYHIECLITDVERKFGRTCKSPADFKLFALLIQKQSGETISESTLRRIWGYSKSQHISRLSTLTTLARTLGFIDWDAYVVNLIREHRVESSFISANSINGNDLCFGDVISLEWPPDREAVICYRDNSQYEVLQQRNSKLRKGDIFKALFFKVGIPMVCSDLTRQGKLLGNYIAGEANGITKLTYMPTQE